MAFMVSKRESDSICRRIVKEALGDPREGRLVLQWCGARGVSKRRLRRVLATETRACALWLVKACPWFAAAMASREHSQVAADCAVMLAVANAARALTPADEQAPERLRLQRDMAIGAHVVLAGLREAMGAQHASVPNTGPGGCPTPGD